MDDLNNTRIKFKKKGYALLRYDNQAIHSYPYDTPWIDDYEFTQIYDKIKNNTLVDRTRCYSLYLLMSQINKIPGHILEVGTWRGGTAGIFTSLAAPNKIVYLADTFRGVVKASDWEHYKDKAHDDTSEKLVEDFLKNIVGVSNYKILNGIFPEETGNTIKHEPLSFVYLDLDVYLSTKDAFDFVWGRVVRGGIVAFDDYGMISACRGISKFVDEIKNDKDKIFVQNLNGQAYIIKR